MYYSVIKGWNNFKWFEKLSYRWSRFFLVFHTHTHKCKDKPVEPLTAYDFPLRYSCTASNTVQVRGGGSKYWWRPGSVYVIVRGEPLRGTPEYRLSLRWSGRVFPVRLAEERVYREQSCYLLFFVRKSCYRNNRERPKKARYTVVFFLESQPRSTHKLFGCLGNSVKIKRV